MTRLHLLITLACCFVSDITSVEESIKSNVPNTRHGYSNYIARPRFGGYSKKSYNIVMEETGDKDKTYFNYNRIVNDDNKSNDYDNTYGVNGNAKSTNSIKRQRQKGYIPYRMRHRYFGGKKRKEESKKNIPIIDDSVATGHSNGVWYEKDAMFNKNTILASREASFYNAKYLNKRGRKMDENTNAEIIALGTRSRYGGEKRNNGIENNRDGEMKYVTKLNDMAVRKDRLRKVNEGKWKPGYEIDDDMETMNSVLRARDSGNLRKNTNGSKKKSINHEYLVDSEEVKGFLNVKDYEDLNRAAKYVLVKDKKSNVRKMTTSQDSDSEDFTNIDGIDEENTRKW